jgi:hypothetical protein
MEILRDFAFEKEKIVKIVANSEMFTCLFESGIYETYQFKEMTRVR